MEVKKLNEVGYEIAMFGLSLNKKQPIENMYEVAKKLATKDKGHNKFLEHIITWWEVRAPLYWWRQMDTYRISSKQSESTMHTLVGELKQLHSYDSPSKSYDAINKWVKNSFIKETNWHVVYDYIVFCRKHDFDIDYVQANLPQGFLQTRECLFSYKTLRNIIQQRKTHKLKEWGLFCSYVLEQVDNKEFLI